MRLIEFGLEGKDRATQGQRRVESPVGDLKLRVANPAVVDERHIGPPHEKDDSLKVQLHAKGECLGTMGHEGVEAGREHKTNGHASKVDGADQLVSGRRNLIAWRDLAVEDGNGKDDKEDCAKDVGEDVDCTRGKCQ